MLPTVLAYSRSQTSLRGDGLRLEAASHLLLAFIVLGVAGCGENEFQPPPPPTVTVAQPEQRDVIEYAEFTGVTEAHKTVEVRARVEGILLEALYPEGGMVTEGDQLFLIDPEPFVAVRDAAQANVNNEKAQVVLAETTAERMESSAADGAVSELQALEARAKADAASTSLEVAQKQLAIKQLDVDYTEVRAPITGWAERADFKTGSLVGTFDANLLTTIYDDTQIYAWFQVPDRLYLEMRNRREGSRDKVEVELATEVDEGFPHIGAVDYVDPAVDNETGSLRVRAIFPNDERTLIPGLFVRCRIAFRTLEDALLVPQSALGADQVGTYLLVVDAEGTVERRNVVLGPSEGTLRVVTEGIEAGDSVIVEGILRARPGSKVEAEASGS